MKKKNKDKLISRASKIIDKIHTFGPLVGILLLTGAHINNCTKNKQTNKQTM